MSKFVSLLIYVFPLITLSSCLLKNESPLGSMSDAANLIQSGDIIVTNAGNDSIVLLDSDGSYKHVLASAQTSSSLIYNGLAYDSINKNILFTYDSSVAAFDAVKSISLYDGEISTVITNNQLTGTLQGLARLTNGDLVILENTNAAEKFLANGTRSGAPFLSGLTATTTDITKLLNGGFIICSSGTANTVRTYNAAGTLQTTATSASPVPTLGAMGASSCTQDSTGRIIVAYTGTTDAVRVYDSTMTTTIWTFTDTNVLTTPGKLAIRSNGNILVTDTAFNHIVEISTEGALVRVIGGATLATPNNIVVVP